MRSKKVNLGFVVVDTATGEMLSDVFARREPAREAAKQFYRSGRTLVGVRTLQAHVPEDWKRGDSLEGYVDARVLEKIQANRAMTGYGRRLGLTTRHHSCDHCGRKDLASTVAFQKRDGSVTHLGRDCAKSAHSAKNASKRRHVTQRLDRFKPHRPSLTPTQLRQVRLRKIGLVGGQPVYVVDGEYLRNRNVDIDFVFGGNGGRYAYVPTGDLWIERTLSKTDAAPTILHEAIEDRLMRTRGLSYDTAHDRASAVEKRMRARIAAGTLHVTNPVATAREWFDRWEREQAYSQG